MTRTSRTLLLSAALAWATGCSLAVSDPEPKTPTAVASATAVPATPSGTATLMPAETAVAGDTASPLQPAALSSGPEATARAASMGSFVRDLQQGGILASAQGQYRALEPFEASWAQIDYYDLLPTGLAPSDFVLRANIRWESASQQANFWNSGCGFAFRMNARGDHYLIYLGMDGNVHLVRKQEDVIARLGSGAYAEGNLVSGGSGLALAVEGPWITALVAGEQVYRQADDRLHAGLLAYALVSGTNKGFGTRCEVENTEVWELGNP